MHNFSQGLPELMLVSHLPTNYNCRLVIYTKPVDQRKASPSPGLVPWEIAYSELEFGDEVGKGSYGLVYKGQWNSKSGPVTVAIKALKDPSEHKEVSKL